jgi:hypothetical protein
MPTLSQNTPPGERKNEETLTPFLERSITELISLFTQLFTTPFAFISYNKRFQDQIIAIARDDLETAYPETVARPLSFFVLLMTAHFFLYGIHRLPSGQINAGAAERIVSLFDSLSGKMGNAAAVALVAFAMTLIIAVKAYLVSATGAAFHCRIRFKTALNGSAYAFGTFIFFLYAFLFIHFLSTTVLSQARSHIVYGIVVYSLLSLSMLLVVRTNQVIRQVDRTAEMPTYVSWFIGTVAWHFVVVFGLTYLLQGGDMSKYWETYTGLWEMFSSVFRPSGWQ